MSINNVWIQHLKEILVINNGFKVRIHEYIKYVYNNSTSIHTSLGYMNKDYKTYNGI